MTNTVSQFTNSTKCGLYFHRSSRRRSKRRKKPRPIVDATQLVPVTSARLDFTGAQHSAEQETSVIGSGLWHHPVHSLFCSFYLKGVAGAEESITEGNDPHTVIFYCPSRKEMPFSEVPWGKICPPLKMSSGGFSFRFLRLWQLERNGRVFFGKGVTVGLKAQNLRMSKGKCVRHKIARSMKFHM